VKNVKKNPLLGLTGTKVIAYISNIVFNTAYCAKCYYESILYIWQQYHHLFFSTHI